MCSTQCEAPVMPGRSLREPTRYQTQTLAVGLSRKGASTTRSPFARVNERVRGRLREIPAIDFAPASEEDNVDSSGSLVQTPGRRRGLGGPPQLGHNR